MLVLLVGRVDKSRIGSIGRTDGYTTEDYERLKNIVGSFRVTVSTPHVLTELSNLGRQGAWGELSLQLLQAMKFFFTVLDERFVPARKLTNDVVIAKLGLADSAIIEAARRGCTVLTDDLPLYNQLESRGLSAINYNHMRGAANTVEEVT